MTKPFKFTLDCGPASTWIVHVTIWPTIRSLRKRRCKHGPKAAASACDAFCYSPSAKERLKRNDGVISELHFHKRSLEPDTIAHEASHVAIQAAHIFKLDLRYTKGEEIFADIVEHIVGGVLWSVKKNKLKK